MFIRLFAQADNNDEAIGIFLQVIDFLNGKIANYTIEKIEPYWKIKEIIVIEAKINMMEELNNIEQEKFLASISDKWEFFGHPIDEALASRTSEGCNYLKKGIEMINIFY